MIIQNGRVEYSRSAIGGTEARLTLTLDINEDNPGAAILWAHQVIDQWAAKDTVLDLTEAQEVPTSKPEHSLLSPGHRAAVAKRAAQVVPQENPTTSPKTTSGGNDTSPTVVSSPSASLNPFAISAPAQAVPPTASPFIPAATTSAPGGETAPPATVAPASTTEPSPDAPSAETTTAPTVELTDNDLHAAAHQAVERKVPATAIKRITAKYAGGSMSMTSIPQDKRAAWLAAVKELKAA